MVPSQRGCGWLSSRDVYVKTTTRRNTDGTAVRYLHLAHNEWDPTAGRSVPKILHSFGREDHLDRSAITRLVTSLSKLLDPADALAATAASELAFVESRPYGGAYVLDALWRRLHLVTDTLEKEVFWSVATLLDLEVDLLFFDTTSTYFELDEPDEPLARDEHGRVRDTDPPSHDGDGDGDGKMAGFR